MPRMPRVELTQNLQRHVACPPMDVAAGTVREALEAVFAAVPRLRSYVLDDQGEVRKHVVIFVDGEQLRDRKRQSDPVAERSQINVMQALSGGSS
jgi:molybdopterin synthase sulfur carrier subunit